MLEVIFEDEGILLGFGGAEYCYTTIPLFEFADEFLTLEDINFAKAQLYKNQNKLMLVQPQINPVKIYNKFVKEQQKGVALAKDGDGEEDDDDDIEGAENFTINMVGGMRVKELGELYGNGERHGVDDVNGKNNKQDDSSDSLDAEDIKLMIEGNAFQDGNGFEGDISQLMNKDGDTRKDGGKQTLKRPTGGGQGFGNYDGAIVDVNNVIEVNCPGYIKI